MQFKFEQLISRRAIRVYIAFAFVIALWSMCRGEQVPNPILESYEEEGYYVQVVESRGYSQDEMIVLEVRIDRNTDEVSQVKVLSHGESEDYGEYITESWFLERFVGKAVRDVLQVVQIMPENSGDIVAITGATRTSEGAVAGVNLALENYRKEMEN